MVSPQTTRIYMVTQINVRICVVTVTTHYIYGVTTYGGHGQPQSDRY